MPEELWIEVHDIVQEAGIKTIPMEKKCKMVKQLSKEALQTAEKRREAQGKGEKERYTHLNAEFLRISKKSEVAQSCPTLCDPMDSSPPGSFIHGIFQEWVAIAFSRRDL